MTQSLPRSDASGAPRLPGLPVFAAGRLLSSTAGSLFQVAVAWQVYRETHSALSLGAIGLARLLPALAAGLLAGAVADSYDRRRIVIIAQVCLVACAAALWLTADLGGSRLLPIYTGVVLIALASTFEDPAAESLLPLLVPRERFAKAVAVSTALHELGYLAGPALGGLLIAVAGVGAAYAVQAALLTASVATLAALRPRRMETARQSVSFAAIAEGLRFMRHNQVLLGAMTLDLFAVVFAGAAALLPIYATSILHVGATGYGILAASLSTGAVLTSFALALLPPLVRAGRALLWTVAAFGLATIAFGFSRSFPLSLCAYAAVGAADEVSLVLRHTLIQLNTPDELRGRISSVASLFAGASNQVGMAESGLVAALTNATFAVVSGGAGCLAVVGLVGLTLPGLRRAEMRSGRLGSDEP